MVHTFSLEGSNALHCIRYLQALQGNPTHFRLHVGLDVTLPSDMDTLFQMLPTRFDTSQLRHLTISLRSSFRRMHTLHSSFPLTEPLLASLYAFSSLVALDLDSFCASELDDAAYERMAGAWPELRSLKVGTADGSRGKPVASVGAVIVVLLSCPVLANVAYRVRWVDSAPATRDGSGCRRGYTTQGVGGKSRGSGSGGKGGASGDAPGALVGHLESIHHGDPCWAFTDRSGRGRIEGLGVVPEVGDAAAGENSVEEGVARRIRHARRGGVGGMADRAAPTGGRCYGFKRFAFEGWPACHCKRMSHPAIRM
ncbi:hypothetical protein J3R83DRAFT_13451 [Lanmaoa asiatica]|nr:hypothetical protein J3R83DRAFT_13451 [Lanmaoa asiatica]